MADNPSQPPAKSGIPPTSRDLVPFDAPVHKPLPLASSIASPSTLTEPDQAVATPSAAAVKSDAIRNLSPNTQSKDEAQEPEEQVSRSKEYRALQKGLQQNEIPLEALYRFWRAHAPRSGPPHILPTQLAASVDKVNSNSKAYVQQQSNPPEGSAVRIIKVAPENEVNMFKEGAKAARTARDLLQHVQLLVQELETVNNRHYDLVESINNSNYPQKVKEVWEVFGTNPYEGCYIAPANPMLNEAKEVWDAIESDKTIRVPSNPAGWYDMKKIRIVAVNSVELAYLNELRAKQRNISFDLRKDLLLDRDSLSAPVLPQPATNLKVLDKVQAPLEDGNHAPCSGDDTGRSIDMKVPDRPLTESELEERSLHAAGVTSEWAAVQDAINLAKEQARAYNEAHQANLIWERFLPSPSMTPFIRQQPQLPTQAQSMAKFAQQQPQDPTRAFYMNNASPIPYLPPTQPQQQYTSSISSHQPLASPYHYQQAAGLPQAPSHQPHYHHYPQYPQGYAPSQNPPQHQFLHAHPQPPPPFHATSFPQPLNERGNQGPSSEGQVFKRPRLS